MSGSSIHRKISPSLNIFSSGKSKNMKPAGRNKITHFLFFMLCSVIASAQTTIKGIVTNSNKDPQSAATIHVKETNQGVYADSTGRFQLTLSGKGKRKLEISSVGYSTRE